MRIILGIIIGIALTIACAYLSDSLATGSLVTGPATTNAERKPVVNWDVVDSDWHVFTGRVRHVWTRLVS
jgi:hypothetical protein